MYTFYGPLYLYITPGSQITETEVNQIGTWENLSIENRIWSQEGKGCMVYDLDAFAKWAYTDFVPTHWDLHRASVAPRELSVRTASASNLIISKPFGSFHLQISPNH